MSSTRTPNLYVEVITIFSKNMGDTLIPIPFKMIPLTALGLLTFSTLLLKSYRIFSFVRTKDITTTSTSVGMITVMRFIRPKKTNIRLFITDVGST